MNRLRSLGTRIVAVVATLAVVASPGWALAWDSGTAVAVVGAVTATSDCAAAAAGAAGATEDAVAAAVGAVAVCG